MESRYEAVRELVENLIADAVPKARAKEDDERARGMELFDGPVARLVCPPYPLSAAGVFLENPEGARWREDVVLRPLDADTPPSTAIFTTATTFLTARRTWPAYRQALTILREHGVDDDFMLYRFFHYAPVVVAVVERFGQNLVGVRSASVATYAGMVSFPAGMVEPGESITYAVQRELREETGIRAKWHFGRAPSGVMVRHPDFPVIAFCYLAETDQEKVVETSEAKGKKFIWVSRTDCLFPALRDGDMQPLVREFRRQGIDVPDTLRFTPDTLAGCRRIYGF